MPSLELTLLQPDKAPVNLQFECDVITMGRSRECAIPIDDRFLSRRHAEIVSESSGWVVRDNGSANGTFVNGQPIRRVTLVDGRIGIEAAGWGVTIGATLQVLLQLPQFWRLLREDHVRPALTHPRLGAMGLLEDPTFMGSGFAVGISLPVDGAQSSDFAAGFSASWDQVPGFACTASQVSAQSKISLSAVSCQLPRCPAS